MAVLDRVVHWNLDFDGEIYGDERERLRWYEGIATAAALQWLAIPWAAAVLVWPLGRPSVLPLSVLLVVLVIPMLMCSAYVHGRRVDTDVRPWSAKRVLLTVAGGLPFVVFMFGALYAVGGAGSSVLRGAMYGAAFGAVGGVVATVVSTRRKRRLEAAAAARDED
jgi:hypothetical protein